MRNAITKSIVFYFPYKTVGGVSILFLRLAKELQYKYKVYIADYSDGYMALNRPQNVELISIDKNPVFPKKTLYIFQAYLPWRFPFLDRIDDESRVLYWTLHPKNLDPNIFNIDGKNLFNTSVKKLINLASHFRKIKIIDVINYFQEKKSIYFMDRETRRSTEELLDYPLKTDAYLQVPVMDSKISIDKNKKISDVLVCAWVGRICDFKYIILKHLIERLEIVSIEVIKIKLYIVGDGEYKNNIIDWSHEFNSARFKIEFLGNISADRVEKILLSDIDLLFAMGTSALEGARIGLPVILTDYSYEYFSGLYRFNYIYENTDYCLGEQITSNNIEIKSSLEMKIKNLLLNYQQISDDTKKYCLNNHSMEIVREKFEDLIDRVEVTFGDLKKKNFSSPDFAGYIFRNIYLFLRRRGKNSTENFFRIDC